LQFRLSRLDQQCSALPFFNVSFSSENCLPNCGLFRDRRPQERCLQVTHSGLFTLDFLPDVREFALYVRKLPRGREGSLLLKLSSAWLISVVRGRSSSLSGGYHKRRSDEGS
jgi:hypothetical protein